MSNCCGGSKKIDKKAMCPECQGEYKLVLLDTLLHQLASPHNQSIKEQSFYFCSSQSVMSFILVALGTAITLSRFDRRLGKSRL